MSNSYSSMFYIYSILGQGKIWNSTLKLLSQARAKEQTTAIQTTSVGAARLGIALLRPISFDYLVTLDVSCHPLVIYIYLWFLVQFYNHDPSSPAEQAVWVKSTRESTSILEPLKTRFLNNGKDSNC